MASSNTDTLKKRAFGIEMGLVAEFLLGMFLNLFGESPEERGNNPEAWYQTIAFLVHGLVGLGLLIGAGVITFIAFKSGKKDLKNAAIQGGLSILLAFCGGIGVISLDSLGNISEISSYVMAVGFLLAFLSYGRLIYLLK